MSELLFGVAVLAVTAWVFFDANILLALVVFVLFSAAALAAWLATGVWRFPRQ